MDHIYEAQPDPPRQVYDDSIYTLRDDDDDTMDGGGNTLNPRKMKARYRAKGRGSTMSTPLQSPPMRDLSPRRRDDSVEANSNPPRQVYDDSIYEYNFRDDDDEDTMNDLGNTLNPRKMKARYRAKARGSTMSTPLQSPPMRDLSPRRRDDSVEGSVLERPRRFFKTKRRHSTKYK